MLNSDSWLDKNKADLQGTTRDFETNPIELAEKGAVVVIDMEGRVLALASYPPYDPNAFIVGGDAAANILLDSRNPLVNYAIGSRDTPGSIFKMVTATAGLLNGQLTLAEQISDGGRFDKYDKTNPPRCWLNQNRLSLHANQTVVEGITHSCNYFFYTVGSRLYEHTDDQLYKTAALYGLTTKTGIDLPGELQGYVASQTTLYDKNKAISAAEQSTWRPSIVFNNIKKHLVDVGEKYNMTFDEEKLNKCVKRLMDMAVDYNQNDWLPEIRTILMEELDMPRELVYLQIVAGDTYIMLNEIKWGGSEAIMAAVGQSITTVTPVEMARYVAAVANGGKVYDLRLIDSIISPDGEVLSESTPILASEIEGEGVQEYLAALRKGMSGVTGDDGTAAKFYKGEDADVGEQMGAKTGTAEKTTIDLENNAWMVAFAPFDDPQIAVCVYIPHGYSGSSCSITIRSAELLFGTHGTGWRRYHAAFQFARVLISENNDGKNICCVLRLRRRRKDDDRAFAGGQRRETGQADDSARRFGRQPRVRFGARAGERGRSGHGGRRESAGWSGSRVVQSAEIRKPALCLRVALRRCAGHRADEHDACAPFALRRAGDRLPNGSFCNGPRAAGARRCSRDRDPSGRCLHPRQRAHDDQSRDRHGGKAARRQPRNGAACSKKGAV